MELNGTKLHPVLNDSQTRSETLVKKIAINKWCISPKHTKTTEQTKSTRRVGVAFVTREDTSPQNVGTSQTTSKKSAEKMAN